MKPDSKSAGIGGLASSEGGNLLYNDQERRSTEEAETTAGQAHKSVAPPKKRTKKPGRPGKPGKSGKRKGVARQAHKSVAPPKKRKTKPGKPGEPGKPGKSRKREGVKQEAAGSR